MKGDRAWYAISGLAILGMLDSLYLLLFQTRQVEDLVCPVFGESCEQVANSPAAYRGGIPDAAFGVAGYALAALTAAAIPHTGGRARKTLAAAATCGSVGAAGLSIFLIYAQPVKTGAWCFWCLVSAGISLTMAPLAVSAARRVLREDGRSGEGRLIPASG